MQNIYKNTHLKTLACLSAAVTFASTTALAQESYNTYNSSAAAVAEASAAPANPYLYFSVQELTQQAKMAIGQGHFKKALTLITELENRGEQGWPTYAKALTLTQQGNYNEAFALIPNLQANRSYFSQSQQLKGALLVRMAHLALNAGDVNKAQAYLNTYFAEVGRHEDILYADRLSRRVARLKNINQPDESALLRIGVLLPLTGKLAPVGKDLMAGIQLALFEKTQKANDVLLYTQDTNGTPEGSARALDNLLNLGVDIVLGPLTGRGTELISPTLEQAGIPLITFSNDAAVANSNTFVLNYTPGEQAKQIARYAYGQERRVFGALVPGVPYGFDVLEAFNTEITQLGGMVANTQFYNPENADISETLESLLNLAEARRLLKKERSDLQQVKAELKGATPDDVITRLNYLRTAEPAAAIDFTALFLPVGAQNLPLITSQLAFYDVDKQDIQLLGTALWKDPRLLKNNAEFITGSLFAAPPETPAFNAAFKQNFNRRAHPLAVLGYDGFSIALHTMRDSIDEQLPLRRSITRNEGFYGAGGAIRFLQNGLAERPYTIYRIARGRFAVENAAPAVLPPALPRDLTRNSSNADSALTLGKGYARL